MTSARAVTVVVPVYDEANRFEPDAFDRLVEQVQGVIFVDDGSTDSSRSMLERYTTSRPTCTLIALDTNVGKGEAVRTGLLHAIELGRDMVGYLDADLATPPDEFVRVADRLGPDVDVVLGSRVALMGHHVERRPARHYAGRVYATLASLALDVTVYDTQCGAKAFRVSDALVSALGRPFRGRWSFDVELLARLLVPTDRSISPVTPDRIVELPLSQWSDVTGSTVSLRAGLSASLSLIRIGTDLRRRRGSPAA